MGKKHRKMENIQKLIMAIEELVPEYLADSIDFNISGGIWALCIIDEENNVIGKLSKGDKIKTRNTYRIAWTKASQVWITGYKTREFERLVYSAQIDAHKFGIIDPDFIGWDGGQPVVLKDGSKLSVGFSGFRGISDLEIVVKAIKRAGI